MDLNPNWQFFSLPKYLLSLKDRFADFPRGTLTNQKSRKIVFNNAGSHNVWNEKIAKMPLIPLFHPVVRYYMKWAKTSGTYSIHLGIFKFNTVLCFY